MQESEDQLVERAIRRDAAAFAAIYEEYQPRIYHFVLRRTSNHDVAEDIAQETFLRAWEKISRYRITGAPFVSWLLKIARHLLVDYYKGKKTLPLEDYDSRVPERYLPPSIAEINADMSALKEAVAGLEGDKQKAVTMRFFEGYSFDVIGYVLNKSEGAVRVLLHRALRDLKRMLSWTFWQPGKSELMKSSSAANPGPGGEEPGYDLPQRCRPAAASKAIAASGPQTRSG